MMSDYLIKEYPGFKHITRVRVGPLPGEAAEIIEEGISPRLYYPLLHWADAVVLAPDRTIIIECKIKLSSDALGQILINANLFERTEEYKDRWELPLIMEVVYAYGDKEVIRMLEQHGVRTRLFRPPYIETYYLEKIRNTYGG